MKNCAKKQLVYPLNMMIFHGLMSFPPSDSIDKSQLSLIKKITRGCSESHMSSFEDGAATQTNTVAQHSASSRISLDEFLTKRRFRPRGVNPSFEKLVGWKRHDKPLDNWHGATQKMTSKMICISDHLHKHDVFSWLVYPSDSIIFQQYLTYIHVSKFLAKECKREKHVLNRTSSRFPHQTWCSGQLLAARPTHFPPPRCHVSLQNSHHGGNARHPTPGSCDRRELGVTWPWSQAARNGSVALVALKDQQNWEVSEVIRGTPSHHPFVDQIFPMIMYSFT